MAESLEGAARADTLLGDFGSWMASEQRRVHLLCRRMLGDEDEADTASQDVFLKAYRALEKNADPIDNLDKWVTRIAVNTCLDRLRSRTWKFWSKRVGSSDGEVILDMTAAGEPDAERQLFSRQIQTRLEQALEGLSARQRAVFTLRHFEALSMDEIAATLSLDLGTVKAHLFRATAKLRKELLDLYFPAEAGGMR